MRFNYSLIYSYGASTLKWTTQWFKYCNISKRCLKKVSFHFILSRFSYFKSYRYRIRRYKNILFLHPYWYILHHLYCSWRYFFTHFSHLFKQEQLHLKIFVSYRALWSSEGFTLNDSTSNFKHLQLTQLTKHWNDLCLFAFPFHCSCKIDRLFAFLVVFKSHTSIAAFSFCVFTLNTGVFCEDEFAYIFVAYRLRKAAKSKFNIWNIPFWYFNFCCLTGIRVFQVIRQSFLRDSWWINANFASAIR